MNKQNRLTKLPRNHELPLLIFVIFFVTLFIGYFMVMITGVRNGFINPTYATWLSIFSGSLTLCCFAVAGMEMRRLHQVTQMRFNFDTFTTVQDVDSEPRFLTTISRRFKKELHHRALVSFSIYDVKKDAVNQLGYQTGATVPSLVFSTIQEFFANNPEVECGFDYNENFLLYIHYNEEKEIDVTLNKLKDAIRKNLEKGGIQIGRDISYGVYFHNEVGVEPIEMLRRSLMAGDFGKLTNQGGITVYEEGLFDNGMANNVQYYDEITQGLERHEFEIYYQPKFNLNLNHFAGAEALIRWHHPQRGFLTPASFIPYAEQSDLITHVDNYVFAMVCQDINKWKSTGERLLPISINISKKSLYFTDLISVITATLKTYKMNPLLLEMEITESATVKDNLFVLSIIKKMQALNIKVGIDDFGTGYSSLSSLKRLPFNNVKIDKSFLADIEVDQKAREVVKAIVKLVHALDMEVIAEGIENEKQVPILKDLGCDLIQGYYYAKPMPAEEYTAFIRKNRFERNIKL
ncbi:MAG: EAL domain-containing protein [Firmicutes bacterium]|nr:EAL domain-containing protein [Bacillota bacterium]